MESIASYSHALVALAGVALIALLQNFHIGMTRRQHSLPPDAVIPDDYTNPVFRVMRAYENSAESMPAFIAAVVACIALGANPFVVNLLAALHFVLRGVYWYIYVAGVGKPQAGILTIVYVASWAANLVLAAAAVVAGFL